MKKQDFLNWLVKEQKKYSDEARWLSKKAKASIGESNKIDLFTRSNTEFDKAGMLHKVIMKAFEL